MVAQLQIVTLSTISSNYIWVTNNFIAYQGVYYIRYLTLSEYSVNGCKFELRLDWRSQITHNTVYKLYQIAVFKMTWVLNQYQNLPSDLYNGYSSGHVETMQIFNIARHFVTCKSSLG